MTFIYGRLPATTLPALHDGRIQDLTVGGPESSWLVLLFYPGDFTFVCPTELGQAATLYREFRELDAEVVSVSTDSVWVHQAWRAASAMVGGVPFPMASDPGGRLSRALGVYDEAGATAHRASFIVDPDGVIQAIEIHADAVGRNMSELLRRLQAAQYARQHPGAVCPAGWQPGQDVLRRGLDLVGAI